jgi:hypothetical protein
MSIVNKHLYFGTRSTTFPNHEIVVFNDIRAVSVIFNMLDKFIISIQSIVYIRNICSDVTPGSRRRHTVRPYLTARHNFCQFKLKYFLVLGIIDKWVIVHFNYFWNFRVFSG